MNKYQFLKVGFIILFRILTTIKISGLERVPRDTPFILAMNHLTLVEPPLLLLVMPVKRLTGFVARKWETHPLVGWIVRWAGAIFVNRDEIDRQALKMALDVLQQGGVLGMAPEGTRSQTGGLIRAKPGIAYLATKANVPVLPVGISGQKDFTQKLKRLQRLQLVVNIGELIYLPPVTGANRSEALQRYADEVMVAIARLIEPELRGVYAAETESKATPGLQQ